MRCAQACVAALLAATTSAAELVQRDVRLAWTLHDPDFSYDLSSPQHSGSGEDGFDASAEAALGVRYSVARPGDSVGLVVGGDLLLLQTTGADASLEGWGGRVCAGVAWTPRDAWIFSAEGGAAYGRSTMSFDATSAAPSFDVDGSWFAVDARLVGGYRVTRRLMVDLALGWRIARHDLSGNEIDLTLDQGGPFVGLGISWRWSTDPPRLR